MKYIDADKLIKAIEEKGLDCSFALKMERLDTLALIDELQQEQPEADLEEEIDKVIADYSFTKTIDSGGFKTTVLDYAKIARHFYELGLNARKEE